MVVGQDVAILADHGTGARAGQLLAGGGAAAAVAIRITVAVAIEEAIAVVIVGGGLIVVYQHHAVTHGGHCGGERIGHQGSVRLGVYDLVNIRRGKRTGGLRGEDGAGDHHGCQQNCYKAHDLVVLFHFHLLLSHCCVDFLYHVLSLLSTCIA